MNNQNLEEFYDELCLNLYLELYKKNKPSISRLNWSSTLGSISTVSFALCSFMSYYNSPYGMLTGAFMGLCAASGLFTLFVLYKRHQIFEQMEEETLKAVTQIAETQKKINAIIGPVASMLGLNIDYVGTVTLDDEKIMEMTKDNPRPEIIIETNCQVIDDSEGQLALSQERAFALKEYINDVAYDGFEDDLATIDSLIMEIVSCEDTSRILNINCEVDELAQKAYAKALDLYGLGR